MIQGSSLYQGKVLFMSHFYIVNSEISILLIMNMNVMMILHGILMMATHLMPLILIKPSQCTQLNNLMHICTCSLTIKLQLFMRWTVL